MLTEPITRASPTALARTALYFRAVSTAELHLSPATLAPSNGRRHRSALAAAAWMLVAALPLVGLVSLLLRSQLDPHWSNHRVHFVRSWRSARVFVLAYAAGAAANRRGDARVLLISLAFLATGGFLGLHAVGTAGSCSRTTCGVQGRDPVGLVVAAFFALASAFVDVRPSFAPRVVRHRGHAPGGARRHGRVVRLDGRRAAAAAPAQQRRRPAQRPRRRWPAMARSSTPSRRPATGTSIRGGPAFCRRASSPASSCSPRR